MLALETWKAFEYYKEFLHWYCKWHKPTYLEVGCLGGDLCASLNTVKSVGIDINYHPDWGTYERKNPNVKFYQMNSDDYFMDCQDKYGLIFIDGDHHEVQVRQDVINALSHLEPGGLIAMHDTLPPTTTDTNENYCGTAYKVAKELRQDTRLEVYTFRVTFGLTLVSPIGQGFQW